MNNKLNVKALLEKLGYSFESTHPPAYQFALSLDKAGLDKDRIIQLVSLSFPIKVNF